MCLFKKSPPKTYKLVDDGTKYAVLRSDGKFLAMGTCNIPLWTDKNGAWFPEAWMDRDEATQWFNRYQIETAP